MTGLAEAGYHRGAARKAVIGCLAEQSCAVSAQEIEDDLRRRGAGVGRASIYRTLEQLEELGLVQRLDLGGGTASFERAEAGGHHHHHLLCAECGRVVPFEDSGLERAIASLSRRSDFEVAAHDVTLRGRCERCS